MLNFKRVTCGSEDVTQYNTKPVICTNLITCSAKLYLRAAERGQ